LEKRIQERRASAKKHLDDAYQIYAKHNHVRAGNALVHLAYLDIDDKDPDGALKKSVQAETYVANTQDSYLGVTVAVLQNIIYHELMELDPNRTDLPSAGEYLASAKKADAEAHKLQNPRLALRTKIAIGLALTRGKHNEEARAIFQEVMEMKRDLQIKGEDPILWNLAKLARAIDKMESEKLGRIISRFIDKVTEALKTGKKTTIPAWTETRKAFDAYLLDELCKVVSRKVSNSTLATILGSNRAFLLNELKMRRQSDDD
jgi:hypothetical protein